MEIDQTQDRCPHCGRYQPKEADGYYAKEIYEDGSESNHVRVFCSEPHYQKYAIAKGVNNE